jgi:uncharacterized repeat protein (TIGR01451 family)
LRATNVQGKALALFVFGLATTLAEAATPPNTAIVNTATASYQVNGTPVTSTGSITTTTAARTPATIEFLQYVPSGTAGSVEQVGTSSCGGTALPNPNYIFPPSSALAMPGALRLAPATQYSGGDPLFVRVTDHDQNLNAAAVESVTITLTSPAGDTETITLSETGPSTGVFIGYLQSTGAAATANNCVLSVAASQNITASYTDPADVVPTVTASALVDPFGVLLDSSSGAAVNGAAVTLVNDFTGLPATVFCDDGVTALAQPIASGTATTCDSVMPPGGYRFPRVAPGTYRIAVTPPVAYGFPSSVAPASLPGGFTVIGSPGNGASYGSAFVLNPGPAVKIDIPLDPAGGNLQIIKTSGKPVIGIGEFLPYTLSIRNSSAATAVAVQISDRLPQGFRYQSGSVRLNGVAIANPAISSDGRGLTFSLGNITASTTVTVRYVAAVTAGSHTGTAENTAVALAPNVSNTARASVVVREDLLRDRAILIGRVIVGSCDDKVENDDRGLANARIVLEDGRTVLTDREGRWHLDNIRPGTHVVQLDHDSLPEEYEVVACEQNTRFAGRSYSQFVNVRGGTLWRADFHVRKRPPEAICLDQKMSVADGSVRLEIGYPVTSQSTSLTLMTPDGATVTALQLNGKALETERDGNVVVAHLPARSKGMRDHVQFTIDRNEGQIQALVRVQPPGLPGQSLPALKLTLGAEQDVKQCAPVQTAVTTPEAPHAAPAQKQLRLVEELPYDDRWLAAAPPGLEWLHPQENFFPAIPAVKIAVKHDARQRVEMLVNGRPVSPLNFDGTKRNTAGKVALSMWRGVDLSGGANSVEMRVFDENGKLVKSEQRTIRYVDTPARAELVEAQSRLIADGKTRPVIAVRITDREGLPVRRSLNGEFRINEPYQSYDRMEGIERDPLAGRVGGAPRYEITADGIALIELVPTTQSGEVILGFQFRDGSPQEVRAWLAPVNRDWILVGFAEGTHGHAKLSGNAEALAGAAAEEKLFDDNRVAFYAKGRIKGEYLLTVAYDSNKRSGEAGESLKQAVDPNQYYTLYADATQPQYDAASTRKLYLKIEKKHFYALFGDYDTGLTVTEFSRYSRTLNGFKSEYQDKRLGYSAFVADTAQAYRKDEIQGNGTSGLYRLSVGNITVNTDKVRIETRDRFRSEQIIATRPLTRYLDYDLDYTRGTLSFREPIPSFDNGLNPVFIVAEYESADPADKELTYGGRVAYKPTEKFELGVTRVHEGNIGAVRDLTGVDATVRIDDKTRLKAEFAESKRDVAGVPSGGNAWKVEVVHEDKDFIGKLYAREQNEDFGLGQQNGSLTGTRKFGADMRNKLSDTVSLQGEIYQQNTLATDAQREVAEGRVEWRDRTLTSHAGLRLARDQIGAGSVLESNQILAGTAWTLPDAKTTVRAGVEVDVNGDGGRSVDFPDRYKLGADYKLTPQTSLFTEQEYARSEKLAADTTRVGLRTTPWSDGELAASVANQFNNDSERLYGNLGLVQKWQINERWRTDFGLGRTQTIRSNGVVPLNTNVPLTSGSLNGDSTAVFTGFHYNNTVWSANGRVEWRGADTEDTLNFFGGFQRRLDAGRSVAAGVSLYDTETAAGVHTSKSDLRLSYAYRPNDSRLVWFDRLNLITERNVDTISSSLTRKLVNNLHANWIPDRGIQVAVQYGGKYVFDHIDGQDYNGYTDLFGTEFRRNLGKYWDVGVQGSVLHSWQAHALDFGLGASMGYQAFDNAWLSVGYNLLGFKDKDFGSAGYRAQGFFIAIRMKFDQDTFGLNRPDSTFTLNR